MHSPQTENIKVVLTNKVLNRNSLKKNNLEFFFYSFFLFFVKKKTKVINFYAQGDSLIYIKEFINKSCIYSFIKINILSLDKSSNENFNSLINDDFIFNKHKLYNSYFTDFLINFKLPRINIIIPNLNHGHYIRRTFNSIKSQGYPNYRVFFLDSKSTDSSKSIVNEIKKKYFNVFFFSRQDQNYFEGLNFFFKRKIFKFSINDIISVLPNSDLYLKNSLFFVGYKFLDSSTGSVGAKAIYLNNKEANNYSNLPPASFKKEFHHSLKNINKLEFLPAAQFFFFKFKYLSRINPFKIEGCHTNSFILIILNILKNKGKAIFFKTNASAYILHFDHSKNFFQSRKEYISRSRVYLINEIKRKKLLNKLFMKNLSKSFLQERQFREFSNLFHLLKEALRLRINFISFIFIFNNTLKEKLRYLFKKYF
jgi:glycosyltransferase involved in cell wall biosynthesis